MKAKKEALEPQKKTYQAYQYFKKWGSGVYHAFVAHDGRRRRLSLRTKDFDEANDRFPRLLDNLKYGIVNFEKPRERISFVGIAQEYLEEAAQTAGADKTRMALSPTTILRHRQAIFGLKKDGSGKGYLAQAIWDSEHHIDPVTVTSIGIFANGGKPGLLNRPY